MRLVLPAGKLSIMCVGAHPDDLEIGCGGTLLRLSAERPISSTYVILTGSPERKAEAEAAAGRFLDRPDIQQGNFQDGYLPESWGDVKRTLHEIAAEQPVPDIVFVPRSDDAHQDHRLLGRLAPTIWRNSLIMHYEIPKWDGDMGRPSSYVVISDDVAQRKVALLDQCYPSQSGRDWWDDDLFLGFMRLRGVECKSRYAEAFVINKCVLDL